MTDDPTHPLIDQVEGDLENPFREGDRIRRLRDGRLGIVDGTWSRMVDTVTLPRDCRPWMIHTITAVMDDGERVNDHIGGHVSNFERAPASAPHPPWRSVLADPYGRPTTVEMVQEYYRWLAKKWHPDRGGTDAAMAMLNVARDRALAEIGGAK